MDALPIEETSGVPHRSTVPVEGEQQFGMLVEVAAPGRDLVGEGGDAVDDGHVTRRTSRGAGAIAQL
jgi:hypothetical protein